MSISDISTPMPKTPEVSSSLSPEDAHKELLKARAAKRKGGLGVTTSPEYETLTLKQVEYLRDRTSAISELSGRLVEMFLSRLDSKSANDEKFTRLEGLRAMLNRPVLPGDLLEQPSSPTGLEDALVLPNLAELWFREPITPDARAEHDAEMADVIDRLQSLSTSLGQWSAKLRDEYIARTGMGTEKSVTEVAPKPARQLVSLNPRPAGRDNRVPGQSR